MNILVTGCNGQLGNEIRLLENEHSEWKFLNTDVEDLDITNQLAVEQYVAQNAIDGIINCAAYTAVDKAEEDKEKRNDAEHHSTGLPCCRHREA